MFDLEWEIGFPTIPNLIMKKILIINGPNLNMLGVRERMIYGKKSLKDIIKEIKKEYRKDKEIKINTYQSNSEYKIINKIHKSYKTIDYFIINPAALTYSSYCILDALLAVKIPYIEVHISNIFSRKEEFRTRSIFSRYATAIISGFNYKGYLYSIEYIKTSLLH